MCIFARCRGLLVLSIVAACCLSVVNGEPPTFDDYTAPSSSSSSSFSSDFDSIMNSLPCMNDGNIFVHGELTKLNDCKFCVCDNSTLTCESKTCPPLTCENGIKLEGECCEVCPNSNPIAYDDLPCLNDGQSVPHGERVEMNDCSSCTCDNSILTCQYRSCRPLNCRHRIKIEGECCNVCPYNVTVNKVVPLVPPHTSMKQGQENEIDMALDVNYVFNIEATSAVGKGLWTLRLWMSSSEDGTKELSGTIMEEALTEEQQSQTLKKSPAGTFVIEDIRYRFDLTDQKCNRANFICAKFNKGPNPVMERDNIPFFFSAQPSEDILTSCVKNHYCE